LIGLDEYLKDIFLTDLRGMIFAANAMHGVELGLHDSKLVKDAIQEAYDRASKHYSGKKSRPSCYDFLRFLEDACKEKASSAGHLAGKSKAGSSCVCDEELATVLPAQVVYSKASKGDLNRFQVLTGDKPTPSEFGWIYKLDASERYFSFEDLQVLGGSWIWFTPESQMPKIDRAWVTEDYSASDYFRDVLGLIHHKPAPPNMENHLCQFRFPKSLTSKRPHFRPTVLEAGKHLRFCAKANNAKIDRSDLYGRTLNLKTFADSHLLEDGAPERVIRPLRSTDFESGERVWFEPLGPIKLERGLSSKDDNLAFTNALLRGKTVGELHAILC
jgi:hypothetical protein